MMPTTADRLYSKVEVLSDGCWRYTGGLNTGGYGNIWDNGRTRSAHVVSYECHSGPVPEGMCVLHTCDYRPCINPEHLFLGTEQDNIDDMVNKGRDGFKGERNGRCLLSKKDVETVRQLLINNTQQAIADAFGVSRSTIATIKSGRNWANG